jgi:release factor glutamine methyltransferase
VDTGAPLARLREPITVAETRRALARAFRTAGLDAPEADARILVGQALGLDHAGLAAAANRALAADEADAVAALAARRLAREPVARIVGSKEFWGLRFRLTPATLVPRPETETVVEAALAAIERLGARMRTLHIADLGTGSGALLLALLSELPNADGVGSDISLEALSCARANAAALGLADRAMFVACDYGAALAGPLDLVVCNPPYLVRSEIAMLAPEVRDYDPARALDGGPDGLDGYRALAADARRLLAEDGILIVELGAGQCGAVEAIFTAAGLRLAALPHNDLSSIPRALVMQRSP